jgi:hypothetical protein
MELDGRRAQKQILQKHKDLLIPGGVKLSGEKFIGLFRPGVYILSKGKRCLYIGKCASQLIKRLVVSNGDGLNNATALETIPCKSGRAADTLERILIKELKPKYNTRGKT